jgi:hypothetical protein
MKISSILSFVSHYCSKFGLSTADDFDPEDNSNPPGAMKPTMNSPIAKTANKCTTSSSRSTILLLTIHSSRLA